ncbi:MAG: protein translocase subunit SecF [Patescibacteria group bacterium]|jgi:preprotein translocase subunit SecF
MFKIIQKRKIWFTISGLVIIPGIIFMCLGGLKLNIDFTGGTLWQLKFDSNRPATADLQSKLTTADLRDITVQPLGDNGMAIRLQPIDNAKRAAVFEQLKTAYPTVVEDSFETIGPTVGKELLNKSITAIIMVLLGIILYISWAFRKISRTSTISGWVMGLSATIALAHDVLVLLGVFAILGYFFNIEIGGLFVTALLTVLGFSVHDTIVVFDRVRENVIHDSRQDFENIVNDSVNQTLARSLNTSLTTLFVLIALYLFGGESIKIFVLAMIIGITTGTYSSIFNASPLLVVWEQYRRRK